MNKDNIQQYLTNWKFDNFGISVTGEGIGGCNRKHSSFKVCDIRGWGHLQYLGEEKAIEVQEAIGELIASAPKLKEEQDGYKLQIKAIFKFLEMHHPDAASNMANLFGTTKNS